MRAITCFRSLVPHAIALLLFSLAASTGSTRDESLLRNGGFDKDASAWSFWFAPGQGVGKAEWVPRDGGGALRVTVERCERQSSVQIYQGPFPVRKGQRYLVSFEARAGKPGTLAVQLMRNSPPYGGLGLSAQVPLTTLWQQYALMAVASADSDDARLDFFPAAGFDLDNVSIRPAPSEGRQVAPERLLPGPGWSGDPGALTDGDPKTLLRSQGHPVQPLLLAVDLGRPTTVQSVTLGTMDQGRHIYVAGVEVEVSNDNRRWFSWARGTKDGPSGDPKPRAAEFHASSLAVRTRYLRLRVSSVKTVATLTHLRIEEGPGEGADVSLLPEVNPAEDLAFLGWDYDRLGYDATPGEPVALRWRNHGSGPLEVRVFWRLEKFAGDEVARGTANLSAGPGAVAELPIPLPRALPAGPVRVRCTLGEGDNAPRVAFHFDVYTPPGDAALDLRVAALLDNNDPEGWVRMIAGPLAAHFTASSDWEPRGPAPDAAMVAAEAWTAEDPRVAYLREYLRGGGRALVFGKPAPGLAEIVPVTVDAEQPWMDTPLRLRLASAEAPVWAGFRPAEGPRHYGVRAREKPGATVLARWEDGTPAVVESAVANGRVVWVGTGSGQVWQVRPELAGADELAIRLLYRLCGRETSIPVALRRAKALAEKRAGEERAIVARVAERAAVPGAGIRAVPGHRNVGRFGWRLAQGGLAENLTEEAQITSPAAPGQAWSVRVEGAGPLSGRIVEQNWVAKCVAWQDARGEVLRSTLSLASPGILWEGKAPDLTLAVPGATHVAYAGKAGVRVAALADGAISPAEMTENWLVLFSADEKARDVPRLVVLSRRPERAGFREGLRLEFGDGGFGALWTSRLWGIRRLGPGEAKGWTAGLPADAVRAARRWSRAFLAFPSGCDEVAWLDGETVVVADRFRYRTFGDAWGSQPLALAPLPPVLSLARRDGVPIRMPQVLDCELATKYGPLEAVEGESVTYRISLPPRDHFGVVPVAGRMALSDAIDRYAVQGVGSVTTASGGLVSSSPFLEDLRRYMSSGRFPPFAAPCMDLYKWWYCFPTVLGRPAYGADARARVDAYHREHYWQTLNFCAHKGFVRFRREPWTGLDYTVSFIWPVFVSDGVRYFVDQNESSAVLAYCLDAYARYYGDWTTIRAHWNLCHRLYEYLPRFHDWAWMASSNVEYFGVAGIDMLNSEYPGGLAFAHLARQVGDSDAETQAMVLAAKSLVPAVARFAMPDYIRSITAEGDPWRENRYYYSLDSMGLQGATGIDMRGGPDSIMHLAIGFLDTSKGTGPEIALAYKAWIGKRIEAYERDLAAEEAKRGTPVGWAHLMQRAFLGWPRAQLLATAEAFHKTYPQWGWQSTKAAHNLAAVCTAQTPFFLADWSPAEYLGGIYDPQSGEAVLRFRNREEVGAAARIYSQRAVRQVLRDGKEWPSGAATWQYDARAGWLTIHLPERGDCTVTVRVGDAVAPLHAYFAPQ